MLGVLRRVLEVICCEEPNDWEDEGGTPMT